MCEQPTGTIEPRGESNIWLAAPGSKIVTLTRKLPKESPNVLSKLINIKGVSLVKKCPRRY